jgi:hypothetical protein
MPTLAFNQFTSQLSDSELANFYYEMARQNSIDYIKKLLIDESLTTTHIVLLSAVDFGASTQGSIYWKLIFNRLNP